MRRRRVGALGRTGTPPVKRCGSKPSRRLGNEVAWPLWRVGIVAAAAIACTSCVVQPAPRRAVPRPAVAATPPPPPQQASFCREFTAPVIIDGEPTEATGEACQQPDGTWQVTENTPNAPQPQVFVVPPPPVNYVAAPYPWWGTANIRIGGGVSF